ncbi:hypothetical protein B0A68_08950 [Flavobacterium reichenbachii]|nr:hypothetical protein B0A68_08950 [Flavobacterium reichenbachii]
MGLPGGGLHSATLTIAPWEDTDNSGGVNHQLNFNNDGLFYRNAYPLDSQWGNWKQILMANSNGNVGIGVLNPNARFEVSNSLNTNQNEVIASLTRFGTATGGSSIVRFGYHSSADFEVNSGYTNDGNRFGSYFDLNIVNNHNDGINGGINFAANSSVKMAIKANGNVGIGITNPKNKLDVKGTVHSQEVLVDMKDWSDFVFKKEYNLPTLEEVEKHIAEKGHLENMPSEEEVLNNGINVGEMNAKLLQKIEELTLYMIEMKKENERIKNDILKLKNK